MINDDRPHADTPPLPYDLSLARGWGGGGGGVNGHQLIALQEGPGKETD